MSVAFTKEDRAETASETLLPDRPISPHPNLVTEAGVKALEFQVDQARKAYETAQKIEDVNERRRQAAAPLRDVRYFAARIRTAQVITNPTSTETVAFGNSVTFRRDDGRVQKYHIVGEDEANPKAGSISFVSPVARFLMGKAVGDVVGTSGSDPRRCYWIIALPLPARRGRCESRRGLLAKANRTSDLLGCLRHGADGWDRRGFRQSGLDPAMSARGGRHETPPPARPGAIFTW